MPRNSNLELKKCQSLQTHLNNVTRLPRILSKKILLKISVFFCCPYFENCWEALTLLLQLNSFSYISNLLLGPLLCWSGKQSILHSGHFPVIIWLSFLCSLYHFTFPQFSSCKSGEPDEVRTPVSKEKRKTEKNNILTLFTKKGHYRNSMLRCLELEMLNIFK